METFNCPSCNASLEYEGAASPTVRCPYCRTTVIVPERLRRRAPAGGEEPSGKSEALAEISLLLAQGKKIEAIKRYRETFGVGLKEAKEAVEALQRGEAVPLRPGAAPANRAGRSVGCVAAVVVLLLGAGLAFWEGRPREELVALLPDVPGVTPFATEALVIGGEEGTGPGFFMDTRWLGVDGEGFIYTGDFDGGRIQRFAPDGGFHNQWFTGSRAVMGGMAVDRDGTVYTLEQGRLFHYEGASGAPLGRLGGERRFDAIVLGADDSLLALEDGRLVRFAPGGGAGSEVADHFATIPADAETASVQDMAADGANNLYLLFTFDDAVYKFDAGGRYVDRFGQEGEGRADFTSTSAVGVDGRGRVFVEDFGDVVVFDTAGRFVDRFDAGGVSFALVFDAANHLYRMDRNGNRVVKYRLLE